MRRPYLSWLKTFLRRCKRPRPLPSLDDVKRQAVDRTETFGGYRAVDRIEALKYNWGKIQRLTLPRGRPQKMDSH